MTCTSCAVSVKLVTAVEPSADTVYRQEPLMPAAQGPHSSTCASRKLQACALWDGRSHMLVKYDRDCEQGLSDKQLDGLHSWQQGG